MSEQEKKPKNKKLLTYYLILGVSLLAIAAITISVIFAVRGNGGDDLYIDAGTSSVIESGATSDSPSDSTADSSDGADSSGTADGSDDTGDVQDASTATEFILPVADTATVTNCYGFYYNSTLDRYYQHKGIDFAAEAGTEVYAAIDGVVESITTGDILKGSVITLSHSGGITTVYTFIEPAEGLEVGDSVSRGDVIATIAEATGEEYKDGAHLHFEVYADGVAADPEDYLDIQSK